MRLTIEITDTPAGTPGEVRTASATPTNAVAEFDGGADLAAAPETSEPATRRGVDAATTFDGGAAPDLTEASVDAPPRQISQPVREVSAARLGNGHRQE